MSGRRLTDTQLTSALRAHLPARARADLRGRILSQVEATPQQRPLPSFLAALSEADSIARRRNLLIAAALLLAAALATAAGVGALRQLQQRPDLSFSGRGLVAFVRQGELYIANPDGGGAVLAARVDGTQLTAPRWSSDARWIAIQTDEPAVLLVDAKTLELRRLATGRLGAWSPDGRSVAFFTPSGDIGIVQINAGDTRVIAHPPDAAEGFGALLREMAWSPDGRWIAATVSGAVNRLVRIDVATGASFVLDADPGGADYELSWSPDSRQLAFVQYNERRTPRPLRVVDFDGTDPRTITDPAVRWTRPLWSPDGAWIAYLGRDTITIARPDGRDQRAVVQGVHDVVGWSPDSKSIVYTVPKGDTGLVELREVLVADGSTRVLQAPDDAAEFTWAVLRASQPVPTVPDGAAASAVPTGAPDELPTSPRPDPPVDLAGPWTGLAFAGGAPDPNFGDAPCDPLVLRFPDRIERVGGGSTRADPGANPPVPVVPGSTPAPQPQPAGCTMSISWAPRGSAFMRIVRNGADSSFEVLRIDGTHLAGPISSSEGFAPTWSPDGQWIAAQACPNVAECTGGYFIIRRDGSERRGLPGRPAWSATGEILAVRAPDGTLSLGRGDGTELRAIGAFPLPSGWAPDGTSFAFVRDSDVWIARADGSGVRNLTRFELGGATDAWWSPDGRYIAVLRGRTLWAFSPDGTEARRLGTGFQAATWSVGSAGAVPAITWSPDGAWLAAERDPAEVYLFRAGDWHPIRVADARAPVWSPDSRLLCMIVWSPSGGEVIYVGNADGSGQRRVWLGGVSGSVVWLP